MKATLFVADLHLDAAARPQTLALFEDFIAVRARRAQALYILGDLFEAWIGDDDDGETGERVAAALGSLQRSGVPAHFLHGNRDFLLGPDYAARAGLTLLPETAVIDLYGTPTLLTHGDALCTDDVDYQRFRAQIREPGNQARLLALPLAQRRAFAAQLRADSRSAQADKPAEITDVNPDAVRTLMDAHGVTQLIHGHTHRPALHELVLADGDSGWRVVLGDWYTQGSVLTVSRNGMQLEGLHG